MTVFCGQLAHMAHFSGQDPLCPQGQFGTPAKPVSLVWSIEQHCR